MKDILMLCLIYLQLLLICCLMLYFDILQIQLNKHLKLCYQTHHH